ncbi:MAG: hypothetical protein IT372_24030 [Polyangiaceae bacterium]|nr:hypothetical protein [Polyangiaceae bacterium]
MAPGPRRSRAIARLAAVAALAMPAVASASPEDILGDGARSSAMGSTGPALAEGYEAVYANPALLSLVHERRLTLGLVGAVADLRAGAAGHAQRLSYDPLKGAIIGATLPIPFGGPLADRVALGLAFFTPFDVVVRGRILYPETPQFLLADRLQSVAVQAAAGADLGHGIRIGGGFAALAALSGSVLVATDASGRVGTVVEDTLIASYGPILGASYDLGAYRIGATFRGELVGRFNVVIKVRDLGQITVPPLNISGVAQYDPMQIALEVARVEGDWKLALGLTFKHWSSYPGPADATVRCPFLFDFDTGQPFTGACDPHAPEDPGYSDTLVPRAGVERVLSPGDGVAMKLRAGAFFEPSPAPEQAGAANVYDNHRAALAIGYGLALDPPWPRLSLDLFSELQVLVPRTHEKAASVPPDNAGAPSVDTGGLLFAFGATAGVAF